MVGDAVACGDHGDVGQLVAPGTRELVAHRFGDLEEPRPSALGDEHPGALADEDQPVVRLLGQRGADRHAGNAARQPSSRHRVAAYKHAAI